MMHRVLAVGWHIHWLGAIIAQFPESLWHIFGWGQVEEMANRTKTQLGKLGETTLRRLAHESLWTVTKADEDEQGWDFLLELDPLELGLEPLRSSYDKRSAPWKY